MDHDTFGKIAAIAKRSEALGLCGKDDRMTRLLDVEHAHAAIPLDLDGLLAARDGDFAHDIEGIRQHINRATGAMDGVFTPRYARVP